MNKKFLIAAATAATIAVAGMSASASAATTDTSGTVATAGTIDAQANVHITADFTSPLPSTIYEGETLTFSVDFVNETGRQGIIATATNVGDGCPSATISPASQDMTGLWTNTAGTLYSTITYTVTGLVPGDCDVTVAIDMGGPNFDANSVATATITVLPVATTTSVAPESTLAPTTSVVVQPPAGPVTGSNSTTLAVMAFGFVLLGWATIAGTRRRHSA